MRFIPYDAVLELLVAATTAGRAAGGAGTGRVGAGGVGTGDSDSLSSTEACEVSGGDSLDKREDGRDCNNSVRDSRMRYLMGAGTAL